MKPKKLNKELIQKIYQLRRDGMSKTGLCNALGFTSRTLNGWLKEAEREDAEPILKELLSVYRNAESDWESDMIHKLNENANSRQDWKAQQWQLKTKMPSEYSEQSPQLMFNQLLINFMIYIQNSPELDDTEKDLFFEKIFKFRETYHASEMTKPQIQ